MVISFQKPTTASYNVFSFDEVSLLVHQRFSFLTGILAGYYIDRGCAKLITSGKVASLSFPFVFEHVAYHFQDYRQV
jgi:hypothetical protein